MQSQITFPHQIAQLCCAAPDQVAESIALAAPLERARAALPVVEVEFGKDRGQWDVNRPPAQSGNTGPTRSDASARARHGHGRRQDRMMAAGGLARLGIETGDDQGADRRRETRHPAWTTANVENASGARHGVILADVSEHGCAIKGEPGWLRAGGFVSIRIGEEPALQGIVRWIRDGAAGMEFLRPIPADRHEWHDLMNASLG
jgi:hypothetical protein